MTSPTMTINVANGATAGAQIATLIGNADAPETTNAAVVNYAAVGMKPDATLARMVARIDAGLLQLADATVADAGASLLPIRRLYGRTLRCETYGV